ncbi:U3 snoRNP protein, partial [Cryomyces antarcticus]
MSRGREGRPVKVIKPQKKSTKSGTASSRKFRFESFSKRISKLTIDPIRRARRNEVNTDGDSEVSSYFKTAFEEWKDLNLSEQYTNFSREVAPLCESLTQVVYYQDRIMDILIGYIAKQDANSLKPLLDLLAHFAHDLQDRFDKHFERAVATICRVAADHADAEVIEWSFNCLAWLFKYLSRLLVPDLRPLYDLMAPMLGKTHQKPFITRFAAEAMSFLMRKAGAVYHRDHKPLDDILAHIMVDHEKEAAEHDVSLYQQ